MIQDPNSVHYACVARGMTILAEFNSEDADLGSLAARCLENTPPSHAAFSHTVRNRTYAFLISDPYVYFAIFDERPDNSERLGFLSGVKAAFDEVVKADSSRRRLENLNSHCFQGELNPVFRHLLTTSFVDEALNSPIMGPKLDHGNSGSSDSMRSTPLLGNLAGNLKKKKRFFGDCVGGKRSKEMDKKVDVHDDGNVMMGLTREFSVVNHKNTNGLFSGESGHQRARKAWKKQVWVVLSLDLIICTVLFVIWLCVCRGFKCID